jgi:hypothetical protein
MANIPPLKKVLPTSPDQIQRFSSEAEAAVARMSHLNRAALYIGNEIATDELSISTNSELVLSKPCGLLKITDLAIPASSDFLFPLIFDEAAWNAGGAIATPAFVQITLATFDSDSAIVHVKTMPIADGFVNVRIYNADTVNDLDTVSFFYTVIPQLS